MWPSVVVRYLEGCWRKGIQHTSFRPVSYSTVEATFVSFVSLRAGGHEATFGPFVSLRPGWHEVKFGPFVVSTTKQIRAASVPGWA